MTHVQSSVRSLLALCAVPAFAVALTACEGNSPSSATNPPKPASGEHAGHDHEGHDHADGDKHDHAEADKHDADGGHGHSDGPMIALGTAAIGGFQAVVTRGEGAVTAGGEAAIDATITGGTSKVAAVRFWIGTQDAKGSMKAKADIEDATNPTGWHTHVEVPKPLPADSKLWVEIEDDKGAKVAGSFDLKS